MIQFRYIFYELKVLSIVNCTTMSSYIYLFIHFCFFPIFFSGIGFCVCVCVYVLGVGGAERGISVVLLHFSNACTSYLMSAAVVCYVPLAMAPGIYLA